MSASKVFTLSHLTVWCRALVGKDRLRSCKAVHQYDPVQGKFVLPHFVPSLIRGLWWEIVPPGDSQRQAVALCFTFTPKVVVRLEAMAFKDGFEGAVVKESDEQGVAWLRYLAPFSDSPCLSPDRDKFGSRAMVSTVGLVGFPAIPGTSQARIPAQTRIIPMIEGNLKLR